MVSLILRNRFLHAADRTFNAAIGRGGLIAAGKKREGDGCTPIGTWGLRECWYRADRVAAPQTQLKLRIITREDGWCDDPAHAQYNRHVTLPFPARHEKLWLEDPVYDLIVPLGYNDDPIIPGKGSAIFLHIAKPGYAPTEGCVALNKEDLLHILTAAGTDAALRIESA